MKKNNLLFTASFFLGKKSILYTILMALVLFGSCDNGDIPEEEGLTTEEQKLIDSLYFSCTINNKHIEFKTPSAFWASSTTNKTRLNRLENNPMDSSILEYCHQFADENYIIAFRFSKVYLLDTIAKACECPDVKEDLYKKGTYPFQFHASNSIGTSNETQKYIGIEIEITDNKTLEVYTTHLNGISEDLDEYDDFTKNSSFQITNSFPIGKVTEQNNTKSFTSLSNWFLEANFKCKLYPFDDRLEKSDPEKAIYVTNGILRGCF